MNQTSIFSFIVVLAALCASCENNSPTSKETDSTNIAAFDLAEMKKVIKEKSEKFTEAHITRDTAFLNNIFTIDARGYPPNSEVVKGRAALSAVNEEWVNYDIKEFREESTTFYGNEEYLIDEGNYYLRYGADDIVDKGNYINIWKQENGEWKIYSNIWNSSLPLAITEPE